MGKPKSFGRRPTGKKNAGKKAAGKKSTSVKVANKYQTKLVKRGKAKGKSISNFMKARKRARNEKLKSQRSRPIEEEKQVEAEDVMDMLSKRELKRVTDMYKRKFDDSASDSDGEDVGSVESYEAVPRTAFRNVVSEKREKESEEASGQQFKKFKLEESEQSEEEEDGDAEEDIESDDEDEPEEPKTESFIVALADREKRLEELKEHVASLSTSVIGFPERNVKKLKELILMLDMRIDSAGFKLAFVTIQKIVALAVLEVFKDIIPGYRVVESFGKQMEEKKRLKRDTKLLWDYERSLVKLYKLYVHRLERMVNCVRRKSSKKSNFYAGILDTRAARERMAVIGATCLSELMVHAHHFNYRSNIIQMVVSLMTWEKCKGVAEIACNAVSRLYKVDKLGEVSLEAVKATAKTVKGSGLNVHPRVMFTFLSLKIKEVKKNNESSKPDMKKVRGKLQRMSRKEKRRNKEMQKLDKQLLEADAQVNLSKRLEYHTEILNQIFLTYFRILKFNVTTADTGAKAKFKLILTPVLMGLSQFAHLINVEFFDDIISLLFALMKDTVLECHQSLHCLKTIFTIITGDGKILNIDPQRFYAQLYVELNKINYETDEGTVMVALECLTLMILKQRRQMTLKRVLAFIKRLATVALRTSDATTAAFMSMMNLIMRDHKQSDLLLDTEKCGSGIYSPDAEDPEFSNANNTNLWELHLLKKHSNQDIAAYAEYLLNNCQGKVNSEKFVHKNPKEVFDTFNCEKLLEEISEDNTT